MKILHGVIGFFASVAMIVILLVTSFEIGAYSDFGWYQKAYEKYDVLDDLEMEMLDVMEVTEEMMAYLRGDREDLVVHTIVDGEEREFFNDREKAHMVDVQNLFVGGIWIRRGAILVLMVAILVLILTKANLKRLLPKSFIMGVVSLIGITAIAGIVFMSDFNKYFTLFHEIFFTNDLWLLDPRTDLLIRMLPEEFFSDMVLRIGGIFLVLLTTILVISFVVLKWKRNKKN